MTRRFPIATLFLRVLFTLGLVVHVAAQNAGGETKEPSEAEQKAKYEAAVNKLP
jgi:hypothetical protein